MPCTTDLPGRTALSPTQVMGVMVPDEERDVTAQPKDDGTTADTLDTLTAAVINGVCDSAPLDEKQSVTTVEKTCESTWLKPMEATDVAGTELSVEGV